MGDSLAVGPRKVRKRCSLICSSSLVPWGRGQWSSLSPLGPAGPAPPGQCHSEQTSPTPKQLPQKPSAKHIPILVQAPHMVDNLQIVAEGMNRIYTLIHSKR